MAEAQSISWEPPSLEDLQRLLPHYEIVGLIGRSGMGAVYRGRQTRLGRDLAIKVLSPSLADENEADGFQFARRFEQEARAMAALSHPCIVRRDAWKFVSQRRPLRQAGR